MREEGLNFVEKQKKLKCSDEQLVDYFGETYASDPSSFRFEIGDRKLIRIVRDHLIKQQNEKGAKYMRRFRKKPDRENPKRFKQHQRTGSLQNEHRNSSVAEEMSGDEDGVLCRQLSASLLEKLIDYMQHFDINDSIIQKINLNFVSVKIIDGVVIAEVLCAVCQNDPKKQRKLKGKKIFYKDGIGSKYWVLSNFGEHLKKVHKLNVRSLANVSSVDAKEEDAILNESLPRNAIIISLEKNNNDILSGDATAKTISVLTNDEKLALAHNFSVEYVDVTVDSTPQATISNGPNVIFNQITSQIRTMLEATLSHNDHTEQMDFELMEHESQSLKIATIARDGSCLFGSLAHQLFAHQISSNQHIETTKQLRMNVVEYISHHYKSFEFELKGRVYEEVNAASITDLDKECKMILENCLPLDKYWGGAETLKAVQEMYHVNILIFNEHGTCFFFNHFNEANTRTLILAFRFTVSNERDHYDSVCDISSNEILNSISCILNTLQKSNDIFDHTL